MTGQSSTTGAPEQGATSSTVETVDVAAMQKRLAHMEAEAARAFEARDKAKAELRAVRGELKVSADADQQALAQSGKWQELAEKYKTQLDELLPVAEKYTAYRQRVGEQAKAKVEALPEDMRDLVPEGLDPEATVSFVDKLTARLASANAPTPTGPSVPPAHAPTAGLNLGAIINASPAERARALLEMKRSNPEQYNQLTMSASNLLRGGG